jgi:hypothetical protein
MTLPISFRFEFTNRTRLEISSLSNSKDLVIIGLLGEVMAPLLAVNASDISSSSEELEGSGVTGGK